MKPASWRLIRTAPAPGAWNMALDEAILETMSHENAIATLRLYAWDPPTLSLGYAQPISDIDFEALQQHGWHLVRRPTGGRAILHTDELTYSVIAPLNDPHASGNVLESYRTLSQALLKALQDLGLPARADRKYELPEGAKPNGAVCFEVPSNYEITVNEKKLVGSAQARRLEGILQHGTLPLFGDLTRITRVLSFPSGELRERAARRLSEHATTVEEILKRKVAWEEAALAFQKGFQEALNLEFIEAEPSAFELKETERLVREKYANDIWTRRI
jgi:lipoyl(octanoyl) transferase